MKWEEHLLEGLNLGLTGREIRYINLKNLQRRYL